MKNRIIVLSLVLSCILPTFGITKSELKQAGLAAAAVASASILGAIDAHLHQPYKTPSFDNLKWMACDSIRCALIAAWASYGAYKFFNARNNDQNTEVKTTQTHVKNISLGLGGTILGGLALYAAAGAAANAWTVHLYGGFAKFLAPIVGSNVRKNVSDALAA